MSSNYPLRTITTFSTKRPDSNTHTRKLVTKTTTTYRTPDVNNPANSYFLLNHGKNNIPVNKTITKTTFWKW